MSDIVGFVGMSHSPFATLLPPTGPATPGALFLDGVARVATAVERLAPDAVVVIGPDHFHTNFYDLMPPFALGVEEVTGFGDFGSRAGELPVARDLAWAVRDTLAHAGFDLSLSYALTVDHGVVQSWEMVTGKRPLPLVPLVVNTAAPPLPDLGRCVRLGRTLGAAIRGSAFPGRVLVIASGGLSHWLPSNDPRDPSIDGARRESVIHGRRDVHAVAVSREARVRAMGGDPAARVNADWDRWFLERIATGELDDVAALGDECLEERAGSGGHEVRTWLIGRAAVDLPLVWTCYEPVPEWITGMGIGSTFEVEQAPGKQTLRPE
ncbi:2,3-dihydroxyphenylpropionate 1,2-dioxygenase [Streptomyces sp. V3I8]|uniref:DODA-type extradiol aromatic ring-opening family dioxygenase n=1 Tax=Streptomyces sp. V3I8 TaxID=3042279 RepID=UPI00278B0B9E|nr:2,3-dihydroxyphenylpropionate 1,2-dioxygenase [Streptomyces sp. V3I8]MDQ1035392.1 2,3-dihydroxyphenylpropionate 1,2-dioxygenase [Streptomyces sp. V3I8]